jgi:hypothetical protein
MIAFLPVARYRVEYQVASGRPFSSFERLLLRAVHEGHDTIAELARVFALHNRVIIEGIVTLMQAGWVSLNPSEDRFLLSPNGQEACEGSELPPTIAVSDRSSTIIVEKLTGQVARNNQVEFHLRKKLEALWGAGLPLRRGDISNIIDPALISPLLTHQPTEWIRWIGPITVMSDNAAFAVIDVNTATERITGIPKNWETLLRAECLDRVRAHERTLAVEGVELEDRELKRLVRRELLAEPIDDDYEIDPAWSPLLLHPLDVLRLAQDHRAALTELASSAFTYLAIACPCVSLEPIAQLLPILKLALDRGIVVNFFLGVMPRKENADGWAALELLKKLEYDSARAPAGGRFVVGVGSTECSTSIVFADASGGASAILGGYNWGAPTPECRDYLSLRLTDPWAVARLCEVLAGFSTSDELLRLGAGLVRLKKAAGELRQRELDDERAAVAKAPRGAQGQILLDRDHAEAIHALLSEAATTIRIYTDNLIALARSGWLQLVMAATEKLGNEVRIYYATPENVDLDEIPILETVMKNGAVLERRDGLCGTLFVADDSRAIITNSAPAGALARRTHSARIGLAIKGAEAEMKYFNLYRNVDSRD